MLRFFIVILLAGFALSACASTRAADMQVAPKAVHVAKAKTKSAVPAAISKSEPKVAPAKKKKKWFQIWKKST